VVLVLVVLGIPRRNGQNNSSWKYLDSSQKKSPVQNEDINNLMAKQKAFFLSPLEIYQQEHPELFEKKKRSTSSKPRKEKIYNCDSCGLKSKCKSPKMQRYGKGGKGILIVGLCPGRSEDRYGIPFVGASGKFLRRALSYVGIDMDKDCIRTNIVQCFPGLDKKGRDVAPTNDQILCCSSNLQKDIEEVKPKLIISLGTKAIQSLVNTKGLSSFTASGTHGLVFPIQKYNSWVGCSYHPSFFCRQKKDKGLKNDDIVFINDMADIISFLDEPLPKPFTEEGNELITDYQEAIDILEYMSASESPVCHDFETNILSPYEKESKILTVSITNEVDSAACIPINFLQDGKRIFSDDQLSKITGAFSRFLKSDAPKVVQNYYMEELWGRVFFGTSMNNFIHDTMVTAHVLNCQRGTTGLGFQAYQLTGHDYKKMVDVVDLQKETLEDTSNYNNWDTRHTLNSYYDQQRRLSIDPERSRFNNWLTSCLPCLANLKHRGILIDQKMMMELYDQFTEEGEELLEKIRNTDKVKEFESIEDSKGKTKKFNPNSGPQIGKIIYDLWKEPILQETEKTKKGKTDEPALVEVSGKTKNDNVRRFISNILRYRKCGSIPKRVKTYKKFLDPNSRIHPTFNMNIAATYRSSANDPSVQNIYKHDEELQVFRKIIIPRPGNLLLQVDYSGMEVCGIAMMSKDSELVNQLHKMRQWDLEHPNKINPWDTHRRWAVLLYSKALEEITKDDRYYSKNGFIFPSFYGSQPKAMVRYEGFRGRVSQEHIAKVFADFWKEYPDVREWQNDQIKYYNENGCYVSPLGCKRPGPLSYYQLFNNNIQGLAFHLLLDALQRIDDEMVQRGMESQAFLETHDSIDFDVVPEEFEDLVQLSNEILLAKRFDWQCVPLAVEWEASCTNWYELSSKTFKELMAV